MNVIPIWIRFKSTFIVNLMLFFSYALIESRLFINVAENRKIKRKENLTFSLAHRQSYITLDDDL